MNKIFYLFILLVSLQVKSQIKIPSSANKIANIESILRQEKSFEKDITSLKKYLEPLSNNKNYLSIYDALIANGLDIYYPDNNHKTHFYYKQSINKAILSKDLSIEIWTQLNYISYLYRNREYALLTPLLLQTIKQIEKITPKELIFPGESFKKIGWIMQTLGDYENAFKYLHLAKSNTPKKTSEYAAITDAIGLNYFFIGNLKKAESYFKETAEMAIEINDSIRYAKAIGNLALIKQKNGNIEDAISLLNKDLRISEKTENDQNTIYASALLIELYIENKDWDKAGETLKKIKNFKGSKTYSQKKELEIIKLELKILQHQNKTNGELSLRRRMSVLEESLKNKEDDMAIGKANWMIQKTKFEKKIDKAENQIKKESEIKNFYAIIIILFLLLSFFLFKNFKKQLKTKKLQHQNDLLEFELVKTKADQKLLEANKNLNAQIDYLKEKNIQIKKLKEEINNVKKSPPSVNIEKKTGKLNTLLESHLMTENNWISFKSEFEKEHPEFYRLLEEDFPEITNSNKRILLLQKLNFSKNEIAELLGITNDAVKKSLQRLKKKLGDKFNVLSNHIN